MIMKIKMIMIKSLLTNLKTLQLPDFSHHLFIINLILWNLYYIHVNVGDVN